MQDAEAREASAKAAKRFLSNAMSTEQKLGPRRRNKIRAKQCALVNFKLLKLAGHFLGSYKNFTLEDRVSQLLPSDIGNKATDVKTKDRIGTDSWEMLLESRGKCIERKSKTSQLVSGKTGGMVWILLVLLAHAMGWRVGAKTDW